VRSEPVDTELVILENIYDSSGQDVALRQRDLAQVAGASLGMTNAILKRLAKKGWITIKKLNNRNIQYAITLAGINEIVRRSYRYFKRTIRNVVFYKDKIEEAVLRAKKGNAAGVLLIGVSDLEFIVEHACQRHGMPFLKRENPGGVPGLEQNTLAIFSETIPAAEAAGPKNTLYLSRVMIEKTAEGL
jgi:DNA-binding MarR family transcriptional regulator